MIDAHVHLEKGDYSVEWIKQFVEYAVKRNRDEVYFFNPYSALLQSIQSVYQFPYVLCYNIYVILLSALRLEHFSRIIQISLNFSVAEKKDKLTQEDVFIHGYSGHVGYTQQSCGV